MVIIRSASELFTMPQFRSFTHPIAVTAPLITPDRVMIGLHGDALGSVCLDLPPAEFDLVPSYVYDPKTFHLWVHGIRRVWVSLGLGDHRSLVSLITDTELLAHYLDTGLDTHEYSLSHVARRLLGRDYPLLMQSVMDHPYPESIHNALSQTAAVIHGLGRTLLSQMSREQIRHVASVELPIAMILAQMTRYGIGVDGAAATAAYEKILDQSTELAYQITGGLEYDLWNGEQVLELLQESGVRFQGQPAEVTHDELLVLGTRSELAAKILEWRELTTDVNFLKAAAGQSRLHPTWNPITKTGRIYAANPPVQNASKSLCRRLLVPAPGYVLIKADYKQVQMRILAALSQDPALVEAFRLGKDVHWLTVEMCGIDANTEEERRDKAKAVNYGIIFQMTATGLARELNTDVKTAQGYIDAFWSRYPVAGEYLNRIVRELDNTKPSDRAVVSRAGRTRRFNSAFTAGERREAKATMLQYVESDILKHAMLRLNTEFQNHGMNSRIVMSLHDAIWVEAPEEDAWFVREMMREIMEQAFVLPEVRLEVEFE